MDTKTETFSFLAIAFAAYFIMAGCSSETVSENSRQDRLLTDQEEVIDDLGPVSPTQSNTDENSPNDSSPQKAEPAVEQITEQGEASEQALLPVEITGAYLTFETATIRCDYSNSQSSPSLFSVHCQAANIDSKGNETLAAKIEEDMEVTWGVPVAQEGELTSVSCEKSSNQLAQICSVELPSNYAKILVDFKVTKKEVSRKVFAEVTLPYQVRVAAGFLPKAPYTYKPLKGLTLASMVEQSSETKNVESGAKSQDINPSQLNLFENYGCISGDSLFVKSGEQIYKRTESGTFSFFVGSTQTLESFASDGIYQASKLKISLDAQFFCVEDQHLIIADPETKLTTVVDSEGFVKIAGSVLSETQDLAVHTELASDFLTDELIFAPEAKKAGKAYILNATKTSVQVIAMSRLLDPKDKDTPVLLNEGFKKGLIKAGKIAYINSNTDLAIWDLTTSTLKTLSLASLRSADYSPVKLVQHHASQRIGIVGAKGLIFAIGEQVTFDGSSKVFWLDIVAGFDSPSTTTLTEDTSFSALTAGENLLDDIETNIQNLEPTSSQRYKPMLIPTSQTEEEYYYIGENILATWKPGSSGFKLLAGKTFADATANNEAVQMALSQIQDIEYLKNGKLLIAEKGQYLSILENDKILPFKTQEQRLPYGTIITNYSARLSNPTWDVVEIAVSPDGSKIKTIQSNGIRSILVGETFTTQPSVYPETGNESYSFIYNISARGATNPNLAAIDNNGVQFFTTKFVPPDFSSSEYPHAYGWLYKVEAEKISVITKEKNSSINYLRYGDGDNISNVALQSHPTDFERRADGAMILGHKNYLATVSPTGIIKLVASQNTPINFTVAGESKTFKGTEEFAYKPSTETILFAFEGQIFEMDLFSTTPTITPITPKSENKDCSSTFVKASAVASEIDQVLKTTLSTMCLGNKISHISVFDGCGTSANITKVAFAQEHSGGYYNLIEFSVGCKE